VEDSVVQVLQGRLQQITWLLQQLRANLDRAQVLQLLVQKPEK
jgi:hypothetical protein